MTGHAAARGGTTASIYVRNSKAIGARNLSQAGMVDECRDLAARLGLAVAAVHIDNGLSGAVRDRPEFVGWLNDGRDARVDVLISWAGDRLTREGINVAGLILDVVEDKDSQSGAVTRPPVRFVSVDDGLDSEHGDAFRMNFMIKAEGPQRGPAGPDERSHRRDAGGLPEREERPRGSLGQPVVRQREIVATSTYAEQWADMAGNTPGRAGLLSQAAESITISRAKAPAWDPDRIDVTWRS